MNVREQAQKRWDSVAKPLHSLGLLEDLIVKIAGVQGTADVEGSTIEVEDMLPGEKFTVLTAGNVTGVPKNDGDTPVTGMLSEMVTVGANSVTVSATASNNLGTSDGRINETYDAMVKMHSKLDSANDPREGEMRDLFDLEAPEAIESLSTISCDLLKN